MKFSERLKKIRRENGMTQIEVASKIHISERHYQAYEAGKHEPPLSVLLRLADLFDVSCDYLMGRIDNPE